jgi:TP901 family phage tail tape measure protein
MADTLEYILSLNDQISSKLQKIGVTSDNALNKFSKLQRQARDTTKLLTDMGGSVGSLRAKLELLKSEKEWIPSSNLTSIRKYNSEIKKLEKEIVHLDTINGSVFKRNLKDAISNIPFSNLLTNPVALAGGALFGAGKMAMNFDEGMSKINTTAQLSQPMLAKLKNELIDMGVNAGADLSAVPTAFEKILSQTGDVKLSTDILGQSLKGAKAGFTDQTVVADALAQSLSLIGKENTNAKEVLDTFFAAKRVGAGEFKDFAQYMPNLISSGQALGVSFKETAGSFAYMTGKGFSAERSAVLMENAFSALGKVDIRKNLKDAGVNVFDKKGSIRSMTDIFSDLKKRMNGMSDEGKSSFLAKMGLVDKEARSAFVVMTSDTNKLASSIKDVTNAQGEADRAFNLSQNGQQKLAMLWAKIQAIGIKLGGVVSTILIPVLDVLTWTVGGLVDVFNWFKNGISDGDPLVITLASSIAVLTIALNASKIALMAQNLWLNVLLIKEKAHEILLRAKTAFMWLYNGATKAVTAATWLWNIALEANPIGAVIVAIIAAVGLVYALSQAFSSLSAKEKLDNAVKDKMIEKTAEQRAELELLFNQLKKAKKGSDEYNQTLKDLEAMQPGIIEKYNLQGGKMADIVAAQKEMISNIENIAKAEAYKEIAKESYKEAFKKQATGPTGFQKFQNFMSAGMELGTNMNKLEVAGAQTQAKLATEGLAKLQSSTAYKNAVGAMPNKIGSPSVPGSNLGIETGTGTGKATTGSKTNESIATGGTKNTVINLQFKNIVETVKVTGKDFRESADKMAEQTGDALLRTLAMAVTTAG